MLGNVIFDDGATEFTKRDRVLMTGGCLSEDTAAMGVVCPIKYLKFAD